MNLDMMNPTIRDACAALGPEDDLDFALASGGELTPAQRDLAVGRKVGCVRAALKIVSTLAAALDSDDTEAATHRTEAELYLAPLAEWAAKPSEKTTKAVAEAIDKHFGKPALKVDPKTKEPIAFRQPDYSETKLRKACYQALLAATAAKPSDAAGNLRAVAQTAAAAIELLANKEGGWSHARLVGIIQGEGL